MENFYNFFNSIKDKLGIRKTSFSLIFEYLDKQQGPINIVETGCLRIKDKITDDLKKIFKNTKMGNGEGKHRADPTGKSIFNVSYFDFENGDSADVTCYNFSPESGYQSNLAVRLSSKEFVDFMRNNPYE